MADALTNAAISDALARTIQRGVGSALRTATCLDCDWSTTKPTYEEAMRSLMGHRNGYHGNQGHVSPKRQAVLEAVATYQRKHGVAPTVREIGRMVDLASSSTIQHHVNALVASGDLLRKGGSVTRGLVVNPDRQPCCAYCGASKERP